MCHAASTPARRGPAAAVVLLDPRRAFGYTTAACASRPPRTVEAAERREGSRRGPIGWRRRSGPTSPAARRRSRARNAPEEGEGAADHGQNDKNEG